MAELAIERAAVEWAKSIGAFVEPKNPPNAMSGRGISDRRMCYRGYYLAFEFKNPDKHLAPGLTVANDKYASWPQLHVINAIRKAGGLAYVTDNVAAVREAFHTIDEWEAARGSD